MFDAEGMSEEAKRGEGQGRSRFEVEMFFILGRSVLIIKQAKTPFPTKSPKQWDFSQPISFWGGKTKPNFSGLVVDSIIRLAHQRKVEKRDRSGFTFPLDFRSYR